MSREDFEGIKEYAKQKHDERVAKTPDRIQYAIQQFEKNNIEYELKNEQIGHFHCRRKCDDKLFQFYAGTGKIQGENRRGIHNLIKILTKNHEVFVVPDDENLDKITVYKKYDTDVCGIYVGSFDDLFDVKDELKRNEDSSTKTIMIYGHPVETLTLGEIYKQLEKWGRIITVFINTPLNGYIYQCGNYEKGKWVRAGKLNGYA